MPLLPAPVGLAVTVSDMTAAHRFYADLCPHDAVMEGVFAGIPYLTLLRGGEPLVTIFQTGADHRLAGIMPTLSVASVAACEEQVRELGGTILITPRTWHSAGVPVAICRDHCGNPFMIMQARALS
jgi:predicted enzyme related to lactoylglutathione lyase